MALRILSDTEAKRLKALTSLSIDVALLEPTVTGLKKSIMDATYSVRRYLRDLNVHDYDLQSQGPENKVHLPAILLTEGLVLPSLASLYRPVTKKGDPRIWFKGLVGYAEPNDILAIISHDDKLNIINLTRIPVDLIVEERKAGPVWDLLQEMNSQATAVSQELLGKLREIAGRGLIQSEITGKVDTAVGRTLETLLGIQINCRKEPDYKGIEIKASRAKKTGQKNRVNLFAKVANWEQSKFKSSAEILKHFGYERDGDFKLYCEVSTQKRNSQGLQFILDQHEDRLIENSNDEKIGDFAVWFMDDLRHELLKKHNETFWVSAKAHVIEDKEFFEYKSVLHTRKPIPTQFDLLIDQGAITMDHLIKRTPSGGAKEKGPLFKINHNSLEMLFPPSQTYDLQAAA